MLLFCRRNLAFRPAGYFYTAIIFVFYVKIDAEKNASVFLEGKGTFCSFFILGATVAIIEFAIIRHFVFLSERRGYQRL